MKIRYVIPLIFSLNASWAQAASQVAGSVTSAAADPVTKNLTLKGWACEETNPNSLFLDLYGGAPYPAGQFIQRITANQPSSLSFTAACGTSSLNYGFSVTLNSSGPTAYFGQTIYIHAITSDQTNPLLAGSGLYTFPQYKGTNSILDAALSCGFTVLGPQVDANGKVIVEGVRRTSSACTSTPTWRAAQWNSKESIATTAAVSPYGGVIFKNRAKIVGYGADRNYEDEGFDQGVNANVEYNNVFRANGSVPWPHMLFEQNFAGKGLDMATIKSLNFSGQFKLYQAQMNHNVAQGYNRKIHGGHYLISFLLQGKVKTSDFVWLAMPLYDDRTITVNRVQSIDISKHKLIFSLGYKEDQFIDQPAVLGQWTNIDVELVSKATEAVAYGYSKGLLTSANIADYQITGMNMGWEVPGLGVFRSKIRNLKLIPDPSQ